MNRIAQFNVSRDDEMYTAEGVNVPVVTQARTFQELENNIREAVTLLLEGEEPSTFGFADSPSILTSFELPTLNHGRKA